MEEMRKEEREKGMREGQLSVCNKAERSTCGQCPRQRYIFLYISFVIAAGIRPALSSGAGSELARGNAQSPNSREMFKIRSFENQSDTRAILVISYREGEAPLLSSGSDGQSFTFFLFEERGFLMKMFSTLRSITRASSVLARAKSRHSRKRPL